MADEPTISTGLTLPQALQVLERMKAKIKDQARTIKAGQDSGAALQKELDDLKKADKSGRVKELEGELRTLKHRSAFDRAAKAAGARDEDLDDLFSLSGYRAEADEPDARKIGQLIEDAKAHPSRKRYFESPAGEDDDQDGHDEGPAPKKEAPADAGRGKRGDGKGTVWVTREQLADPKFALDPKNAELLKTAKIKG